MAVGITDREFTPVPLDIAVPPQLPVYQSVVKLAPGFVTEIVDDAPLQIVKGLAEIPVGVAGNALTVTTVVEAVLVYPNKVAVTL